MTTTTTHEVGRRDCDACNGSGLQRGNPTGTHYTHPDDVEVTCGACDGAGEWTTCPRCSEDVTDEPGTGATVAARLADARREATSRADNVTVMRLEWAVTQLEHVARTGQCWDCDEADQREQVADARRAAIHVEPADRRGWCMCCARPIAITAPVVALATTDHERNDGSIVRIMCVQCALRIEAALGEHQAVAS